MVSLDSNFIADVRLDDGDEVSSVTNATSGPHACVFRLGRALLVVQQDASHWSIGQ